MANFSTPLANAQVGFDRAFRYLLIYSKDTTVENVVQSFILRKVITGAFQPQYCRLWVDQTNLYMEEITDITSIPNDYATDTDLVFNNLDFGYIGSNQKHLIVGTGDVRYRTANPPVAPAPQVILYEWPTSQQYGLIFTCNADYKITIYRRGTTRRVVNIPDNKILNP